MTLKKLIEIIVFSIEKVMLLENLKLGAVVFDKKNIGFVSAAMESINSKGTIYNIQEMTYDSVPDILFIDELPIHYYGSISLGIGNDPFSLFVQSILIENKTIVVLKESAKTENKSYGALIETYKEILTSYGIVFGNEAVAQGRYVYNGNVLSAGDILSLSKETNKIYVKGTTIVTSLAYEKAASLGINIE